MADYLRLLPEIILTFVGIVVMMLEAVSKGKRTYLAVISMLGIAAAFAANIPGLFVAPGPAFHDMVSIDAYGIFFRAVVMGVGFLSILASISYLEREQAQTGEYYALILFSIVGQCIMVTAADLIMVFIGLEISSIATYVLAGFLRDDRRNNEAALKYFLLGSFATGVSALRNRLDLWLRRLYQPRSYPQMATRKSNHLHRHDHGRRRRTDLRRPRFQGFRRAVSDVGA